MHCLCCFSVHTLFVFSVLLSLIILFQIEDTEQLLVTLEKRCPTLHYLSLLGNRACPNELLQSGHDDEDYQRYR